MPAPEVTSYLRLVRIEAAKLSRRLPSHVELDELVGEGLLGFVQALGRRPENDDEFLPFALTRIRGQMLDYIRRQDIATRRDRELIIIVARSEQLLTQATGEPPSDDALAAHAGMTLMKLSRVRSVLDRVCAKNFDAIPSRAERPDEWAERTDLADHISALVDRLPERLSIVIRRYYEDDFTYAEIAPELGVTEARICQMHKEAIERLRDMIAEEQTEERAA